MEKRILHLTLMKKWFDLIAKGEKDTEYRKINSYWESRLFESPYVHRTYDEIHARNGYDPSMPFMRIKWNGFEKNYYEGKVHFCIDVSEVLEIINWEAPDAE